MKCDLVMEARPIGNPVGSSSYGVMVCRTHGLEFNINFIADASGLCPFGRLEERLEKLEQGRRSEVLRRLA